MNRKILVMGLPGSGKTTITRALAPMLNAVVFNNDEVRANINRDLGFTMEDRVEQARRMGWLCDRVVESGGTAIADFICPTPATRAAFGAAFVIFVDRIKAGRFDDTNPLSFFDVSRRIEAALRPHAGRFVIVPLPNITHVFYGRDVGYVVERIVLDEATEAISATHTRKQAGLV